MPTLYVIRHAEPAVMGVLLGQSDPPLSEHGARQAAGLAALLPECPVYSSPLLRALQTAIAVVKTPIVMVEFAEITYGEWDGLSWNQIEEKWPDIARRKINNWEKATPPGGELWEHFSRRVRQGLTRVQAAGMPAVIVAHEAVNAIIANHLRNSEVDVYQQKHCDITQYQL